MLFANNTIEFYVYHHKTTRYLKIFLTNSSLDTEFYDIWNTLHKRLRNTIGNMTIKLIVAIYKQYLF